MYFEPKELLALPLARAAYSDRTAWLMAKMSKLAYLEFEKADKNLAQLNRDLEGAEFSLMRTFNKEGTQAFLAANQSERIAVLAFRGTEIKQWKDILSDLDFRFYKDLDGSKVHTGFLKAFNAVRDEINEEINLLENTGWSIYLTGHSLGGAIALVAAHELSSDNIAACYTFGSPRVGNSEFGDKIKSPIYRIVHANDLVPRVPFPDIIGILYWTMFLNKWNIILNLFKVKGRYSHQGDQRYLTPCKEDCSDLRLISNPDVWVT